MQSLHPRLHNWTLFFILGLVISGATALPIPTELEAAVSLLGEDMRAGGAMPEFAARWFRTLKDGIRAASAKAPFLFYGTDWLAFGHFVIALAFVGALRDPVRNRWLYQFGMLACALVPLWAFTFGQLRDIPVWWRLIDSAFGIVGFVPMWRCHRWIADLERAGLAIGSR